MRPRLLLVAPSRSYRVGAYLAAARALQIDLVVASPGKHSLVRELAEGLHIDLAEPDDSLQTISLAAQSAPFDGIVATDDSVVELAARAAAMLSLRFNSVRSARLTCRKDLARSHLQSAAIPVPQHRLISLQQELTAQMHGFSFPCVLKPLNLSASKGVIRADDLPGFIAACERIRPLVADQTDPFLASHLLVEAYIDGFEVALEGFLSAGRLSVLALFDKPDPLVGPFFEETYYITPSRLDPETQRRIQRRVAAACSAFGLTEGPVHAELRVTTEEAWILEVAGRTIGGECGHIFDLLLDQAFEGLTIANAVGLPLPEMQATGAAGVLMIPIPRSGMLKQCDGIEQARAVLWIEEVRINAPIGHELVALPEGSSYLGFVYSRAETPQQAEAALREAHRKLSFRIDPVWHIG